jgi:hypothetical protein
MDSGTAIWTVLQVRGHHKPQSTRIPYNGRGIYPRPASHSATGHHYSNRKSDPFTGSNKIELGKRNGFSQTLQNISPKKSKPNPMFEKKSPFTGSTPKELGKKIGSTEKPPVEQN